MKNFVRKYELLYGKLLSASPQIKPFNKTILKPKNKTIKKCNWDYRLDEDHYNNTEVGETEIYASRQERLRKNENVV